MAEGVRSGRAVAVAVVVAAALVRFHGLGTPTLAPAEASNAVIAWDLARGAESPQPADPAWSAASPLLASAQFLLFGVLGAASEAAARAPSALAGTALVLCPWLLRRRLGVRAALVLSSLVALDPVCVEASRRAEGTMLAALLGTLILVAEQRGGDASNRERAGAWRTAAAVALGLLLVTGAAAWTVAPLVALASLFHPGPRSLVAHVRLARLAAAAALAGASGLLGAWALVGGVSASLTAWLAAWSRRGAVPELRAATLFADPLALALGGAGLLCLVRERRLAAVAALGAALWWTARTAPDLVVLVVIASAAPAVHEVSRRLQDAPGLRSHPAAWVAAILAALALAGIARTVRIAAPGLDAAPLRYAGIDVLARDVERLSAKSAGDPQELAVEVVCQPWPDPLLRWTLRGARRLRFHAGSPDPGDRGPALVIGPEPTTAGEAPCQAPPARSGARYLAGSSHLVLWVPHER